MASAFVHLTNAKCFELLQYELIVRVTNLPWYHDQCPHRSVLSVLVSDVCVVFKFPQSFFIYMLGHLADTFIQGDLQWLIHTLTAELTMPAHQEQSGWGVLLGDTSTQRGGTGDRTSNLSVTGQPALPPKLTVYRQFLPSLPSAGTPMPSRSSWS